VGRADEEYWRSQIRLPHMAGVSVDYELPAAPGNELSWFPMDMEKEPRPDVSPDSVAKIHELVSALLSSTGATRVVLGGFSQGGALALAAGLTYPDASAIACVAALSSWLPPWVERSASRSRSDTPVLFSCGTADKVVSFAKAGR
jgi:predicted esterase